MSFEIGAQSDVGRRREGNEDALHVQPLPKGALCIVADGMGGHQAGEIASRLVVEAIPKAFSSERRPTSQTLLQAIQQANRAVFEASRSDAAKQGMGTTVVCALLQDSQAQVANVGDSPAFLVRDHQASRLTEDHSWVAEELARGAIRPDEAAAHPYRHILTRSLGTTDDVEVQLYEPLDLRPGDVVILCSDGLSEHVEPRELPALVSRHSAQAAAEKLVTIANDRGGSDNVSVIVARYQ